MSELPSLGYLIRQKRKRCNMTQMALALESGVDYNTLRKIERGGTKDPAFTRVAKIARCLSMDMDTIYHLMNPMPTTTGKHPQDLTQVTFASVIDAIESVKHNIKGS